MTGSRGADGRIGATRAGAKALGRYTAVMVTRWSRPTKSSGFRV